MARRDDDYRFLNIRDALAAINQKVNLIGVAAEFSVPKQTKGTGEVFWCYPFIEILKSKQNKLLGVPERDDGKEVKMAPRNPPWVECCIKSYYLDERDTWGSRRFRIFDTRVVG